MCVFLCERKKMKEDRLEDSDYMCKHICNCVNVCVHALKTKPCRLCGGVKRVQLMICVYVHLFDW